MAKHFRKLKRLARRYQLNKLVNPTAFVHRIAEACCMPMDASTCVHRDAEDLSACVQAIRKAFYTTMEGRATPALQMFGVHATTADSNHRRDGDGDG